MTATVTADAPTRAAEARGRVWAAYRWEAAKLVAQARTRATLTICLVAPFVFVVLLDQQSQVPKDTLFGRWIHASGFATPLFILGFASQWVFPLLTSIVAGDIFSSEDQYGTWKTILTRSHSRTQIFLAKTLAAATFAVLVIVVLGLATLAAGLLLVGHQPLEGLSGTVLPSGRAADLVLAAWATTLPPLLGFTALGIMLSVLSRNSAVGIAGPLVIGLVMQVYTFLNGPDGVRHLLLVTPFDAWHGLARDHPYYGPLWQGALVSAGYVVVCLTVAHLVLRRRDITGG
ncbi:ABC transporter permease [Frankia sp. AgB1.9]|uniref:ABC transporter permease n=1 Tax=unclassified Frankia TaxID=2632575 RepID=UPI001932D2D3|nr:MULTISPECIES: ABC transporter permease [unclassified Frankia]MBL7492775.1 ABC transporter permease [Frankia sp. AgW1.1]MBL7549294.1 ABC transporter permease [Frankia sp. AgB1.9]MBL7619238.1 ABC transporter permease [Frankia sp. AgB1.8]